MFHDLSKSKTGAFVNLNQDNSNESDCIGEVKTSENNTIYLDDLTQKLLSQKLYPLFFNLK